MWRSLLARAVVGLVLSFQGQARAGQETPAPEASETPLPEFVLPTVEEDVAFGLKNLRLGAADITARVTAVLRRYGLEDFRHHPAHLPPPGLPATDPARPTTASSTKESS